MQRALLVAAVLTAGVVAEAGLAPAIAGPSLKDIKAACYSTGGPQKDCTMLIARSIVANSKVCIQTVENDHADGAGGDPHDDYDSCVTNFCFKQCASNRGCTDFCTQKAQSLFNRLAPAPVLLQTSVLESSSSEARAAAWLWLRVHAWDRLPSGDELGDLKSTDPRSYAIVQALLAKQSMGVLNYQRPSAGFADTAPQLSEAGAASLAKMEAAVVKKTAPAEEKPQAPAHVESNTLYPEAGTSHHNWLNWKSADTDDQILAGLGASGDAPESTGSLLSESGSLGSTAVADDPKPLAPSVNIDGMEIPKMSWGSNTHGDHEARRPKLAAVAAKPTFMTRQANDYNAPGGIDFSEFIPSAEQKPQAPKPKAAMVKTEAEIEGIDFKDDLPERKPAPAKKAAPTEPPVSNVLTNFDFDVATPEVASAAQTNVYLGKVDLQPVAQEEHHANPYMTMMGMDAIPAAAPDAALLSSSAKVSQPETSLRQPKNGYLRAINFSSTRKATSVLGSFEADLD